LEKAILEPKLVNNIKGEFFIPAYQRGYRWEPEHITMLLNDIWENGDNNYCLQPVVVKKLDEEKYELIDGQQRTTSLFLILKYMKQILPFIELNFFLTYKTRPKSEEFLKTIDPKLANEYIDHFYMFNAYEAIDTWFNDATIGDRNLKAINLYKYFGERVKVIWYEVLTSENATALFTRLNIGKIPLTNAELVKALFLSKDSKNITDEKQLEISTSWDLIERELQDNNFWYFLTNQSPEKFATRIELIFNLMSNKEYDEKEKFYTFFYFIEQAKKASKIDVWQEIQSYFLILKEWYEKRDIYHKLGYLVSVGKPLQSIIIEAKGLTKSAFKESLGTEIKNKLDLTAEDVLELNYSSGKDREKIDKLLLLHNVETVRTLKNSSERYSFKSQKTNNWSLEHIHAQKSEGLNKKEDQQKWLKLHKASLENLMVTAKDPARVEDVIKNIDIHYENITQAIFETLFNSVFELLSENEDRSYMDSISNMALLSISNNAALNNATFDVKRNRILEMDKEGQYIPITTRRIFLKYYTDSKDHQLHFWGQQDRDAYIDAMIGKNGMLKNYLKTNEI